MRTSLCLLLFVVSVLASAHGAAYVLRMDRDEAYPLQLPTPKVEKEVRALLEYKKSDPIVGFVLDLNGDNKNEYIVQANASACGEDGCPYEIIDGSSNESIGTIFGDPLIVSSMKIQGHLVIQAFGRASHVAEKRGVFVFDEGQYVEVSDIRLISN